MYNIYIKNKVTGKVWGQGTFYTGDDLDALRTQEKEFLFGKPDRWVLENKREPYELNLTPIETRDTAEGKEYHFEADYIFTSSPTPVDSNETTALGARARKCCEEVHNYVTGYNLERHISTSEFQQVFSQVFQLVLANRPNSLKAALLATPVDGVLVTQDLKDTLLSIFRKYGF